MNKKIIAIITVGLLFISGCATTKINTEQQEEKLSIVTTIFPQYDFVREIGKDNIEVKQLLKPGAESHSYEPTPQDIKDIQNADIFIYVGGPNDVWVEEILESMGDKIPQTMKLIDMVDTVDEVIVEGMQDVDHDHDHDHDENHDHEEEDHDHDHDHEGEDHDHDESNPHTEIDEHVWTSPINAIKIVNSITNKIIELDPIHEKEYTENKNAYILQLEELDKQFKDVVSNTSTKTLLFGDRFPFRYLADEYGLTYYAAFPGCSTETEASAQTVAFLADKVKQDSIPVVFTIELSNGKIADSIIESSNAKKLTLHSVHNLSKDEFEKGETYISLMKQNVSALKEALK